MSTARVPSCRSHESAAECEADTAHRCFWSIKAAACRAVDKSELDFFEDKSFAPSVTTIPQAMTCPGSKAWTFYGCFGRTRDCETDPNCFAMRVRMSNSTSGSMCFPKYLRAFTPQQFEAFMSKVDALDAELYGSCDGACFLRQARLHEVALLPPPLRSPLCAPLTPLLLLLLLLLPQARACAQASNTSEATCKRKPYCIWKNVSKVRSRRQPRASPGVAYATAGMHA